ncbi:MAG: hypothetical protein ACO1TE_06375 [Prosthecobacter sp.]
MRTLSAIILLSLAFFASATIPSCREKGPAEKIGDKIDDATDSRPGEKVRDAVEDVTKK